MLVRAYRLTDRLGLVLIKSIVALVDLTLAGLLMVRQAVVGIFIFVLRPFGRLVGGGAVSLRNFSADSPLGKTRQRGGRLGTAGDAPANARMARRTFAEETDVRLVEDPLRVQNRVLSGLVIVMGVVVLGVILWATDPSRSAASLPASSAPLQPSNFTFEQPPEASLNSFPAAASPMAPTVVALASPVPTATTLPEILAVRGTLAYVARELGQTDIWVIPVGSRTPLRITNSPEDERDPAWSPDGRRLAYASRQDGNWEIYIYDVVSGQTTRMTYDLSFQAAPQWSPDGEWLVYESYQGSNLDVYVVRVDGSEVRRLTDHPAPDFAPSWSPDGRRIAFVSWRDGSQDVYIFDLNDPRDAAVINVTNTPTRDEAAPDWNPDGELLAYSAFEEGLEVVFIKPINDLDIPAQVLDRGRAPTWSPDGASLVFAVDSTDNTLLVASPFAGSGVATEIIPVARGASDPDWTAAPLPQQLINAGGLGAGVTDALFIEQENPTGGDPPYRLSVLNQVSAPNAVLSERVNDSFNAARQQVLETMGWDMLGTLEDAFWQIDRPPQPGEERRNWLMTGRAFAINRNLIAGFPASIEVVREDRGVEVFWRVFVRVSDDAQSGELGEPLRAMPWDFASRNQGDVEAYDQGGRLRTIMPEGYYVDLTQIMQDYGWARVPAGSDWRANFNSTNYWLFRKTDGLEWLDAMRELYTEGQLGGFVRRPTPDAAADAEATAEPEA
jgi:TolB protein